MIYQYQKDINNEKLKFEIATAGLPAPLRVDTVNLDVIIEFSSALDSAQELSLSVVVQNHVKLTSVESLSLYLDNHVFPFVENLVRTYAAENIAMGITQMNKSGAVLGMFVAQHDVNNDGHPFSLKDSFDTGSLYESIKVLQHIRNNPSYYTGLSPFVTDERLRGLQNKIETFLGVPLSP